jgi:hypothetical protein
MEAIQASTAARIKVQDAMQKFPRGGTLSDIAAVAKVSNKAAKGVLHDLVLGEAVIEWAVPRSNKQTYSGFILANLAAAATKAAEEAAQKAAAEAEAAERAKAESAETETPGQSDSPSDVPVFSGETPNHPDNPL